MKLLEVNSKKYGKMYAKVDDEDFERISCFNWYADFVKSDNKFRARSRLNGTVRSPVLLHRFILNVKMNELVDHKNMDSLDNQKSNLRITNKSGNMKNRNKQNNNTSGFKGVSWSKKANKWRATIRSDGKWQFLGHYDSREEAARAYDFAAKQLHKDYARTNY